jgi:riboflavin kinase/FMN adenylyltransferase
LERIPTRRRAIRLIERNLGSGQRGWARVISIDGSGDIPETARGAIVTVGNFDGVHRGHQRLLARARARADAAGVPALAITFDPHPVALLRPEAAPVPLVWLEREISLLKEAGASLVGVFRTGPWLLELTAREFFDRIVREQLGARGMVEGPNFAFGHDRLGDVRTLEAWCGQAGIDFEVVELADLDGRLISSSLIRRSLSEGDVALAARFLCRPHRIRGNVAKGAGRGATIGFPTINLEGVDTLVPADGVYAGVAWLGGEERPYPAACNIGPNPTFGEHSRKIEAHLIGFAGDLYGKGVELDFLERLRPTRKFAGREELVAQIAADVQDAERISGSRSRK